MLYFIILSVGSLAVGFLVSLPDIYRDDPHTLYCRKVLGLYLFAILMLNWVCIIYYHRFSFVTSQHVLPKYNLPGQRDIRNCYSCAMLCPPRSKHCNLCNQCILKRDHHCFFGGCCVGFYNQRYFIVFCFYGTLGALYSCYVTLMYLSSHYANLISFQFYQFLLPCVAWNWLTGQTHLKIAAMVIFSYFCFMTFLACLYYFTVQCILLCTGQTLHEFLKSNHYYRCSLKRNLASVFGPFWYLNFLVPMPFLKSVDNGIDWKALTFGEKDK